MRKAERIKEQIDPIDFYQFEGQEVSTRGRSDWKVGGLCPFHADRYAGSFYIHEISGAFHCFSCEAKGSDIIAFVQKKYDLDFQEAINKLIQEWRV